MDFHHFNPQEKLVEEPDEVTLQRFEEEELKMSCGRC